MAAEFRPTFILTLRQLTENNSNDTLQYNSKEHFTKVVRKAVIETAATLGLSDLPTQESTNGAVLRHELILSLRSVPVRDLLHFIWKKTVGGRKE